MSPLLSFLGLARVLDEQEGIYRGEAAVEEDEADERYEDVARRDRPRYRVLRPEQPVHDPGLAADLGQDPAELAGEIGEDYGERHDPQEPAPGRERIPQRERQREQRKEHEEEA